MMLVQKSVKIRPELWKKLRIHADMSGMSLRAYLSHLIIHSRPLATDGDTEARTQATSSCSQ